MGLAPLRHKLQDAGSTLRSTTVGDVASYLNERMPFISEGSTVKIQSMSINNILVFANFIDEAGDDDSLSTSLYDLLCRECGDGDIDDRAVNDILATLDSRGFIDLEVVAERGCESFEPPPVRIRLNTDKQSPPEESCLERAGWYMID